MVIMWLMNILISVDKNNCYGDNIIKEYSQRLSIELNKNYSVRYLFVKVYPVGAQLTISHCRLLFRLNNDKKKEYYINQVISKSLNKRELELIIKSK